MAGCEVAALLARKAIGPSPEAGTMIIPRVWTDTQGDAHFADLDMAEQLMPVAVGLPRMRSTARLPVTGFRLITTSPQAMAQG